MTDTMSARQRIAGVIGEDMSRDTELWHPEAKYTQADRIIDIVREALLSDEVVSVASFAMPDFSEDASGPITAALDAAFGDQQP